MSDTPDGKPSTLADILDSIRLEFDPGETLLGGCDGRVTRKVDFLQHPRAERAPYVSHFLAVTDRRVLMFSITPKLFTRGLAGPAELRLQAPRGAVHVAKFKRKMTIAQIQLQFAEGMVPFEVNMAARDILANIASLLTTGQPRA